MAVSFSPLSPDPGYEHTAGFFTKGGVNAAPTRTRPEAQSTALLHTQGTISRLLRDRGETPLPQYRPAPKPKNFSQLNHQRIRAIAAQGRKRREEVITPPPPRPATTTGHTHKPEPPQQHLQQTPSNNAPKNFLTSNIRAASRHGNRKQDPKKQQLQKLEQKKKQDFESYQINQRGKLPQYLVSRRKQWLQEARDREASRPDPTIPPGHCLMPEGERRQTLDVLNQHEVSLTQQLQCLPLRIITLSQQNRKSSLEQRLKEVEDAIRVFSRPKVFVKLDQ